jgi:hypothetical protein
MSPYPTEELHSGTHATGSMESEPKVWSIRVWCTFIRKNSPDFLLVCSYAKWLMPSVPQKSDRSIARFREFRGVHG